MIKHADFFKKNITTLFITNIISKRQGFFVTSQKLRKEGFRFFMEGDIFFVYHNVTEWPNIYDFFKKLIWFCRKETQIINIGSRG